MTEPVVIDKNKSLLPSQDYAFLREQGLAHLRSLSGKIWTDHNLHDPGITILEVLCYALTDLGYRTAFDLKDLLASGAGALAAPDLSGLFPAHEILTNTPLTISDYRRLLLKIEGVRNAWLDPMTDPQQQDNYRESEIALYVDCGASALCYQPVNQQGQENLRVRLSGLYKVLLELEISEELGSLNETRLVYQPNRGPLKGVVLSLDSKDQDFLKGAIDFSAAFQDVVAVDALAQQGKNFSATVRVATGAGQVVLDNLRVRIIDNRPRPNEEPVPVVFKDLRDLLADGKPGALIPRFWAKQQARNGAIDTVRCVLNAHRNLCEDFLSVQTVAAEQVAICADIEVKSDADLEEVQARVYHAIETYFNPPVRYFSLKEMLDEGLDPGEIFNAPYWAPGFSCGGVKVFNKPGFIKTADLVKSKLRRVIYTSDLINILMDFPEIISIKNVLLRKYGDEGTPAGGGEKWSLPITPNHQPVLAIENSKLLFFKNQIPYRAKVTESQKTLDHLRAMARKAAYVDADEVLQLPPGRDRDPGLFLSIQHDFPKTYGIGETGLPAAAPEGRVAQARQLKAYLTFYDQVLADYLAQLGNVGRFFSLDKDLKQSYFSQYLKKIDGVRDVFEDEFYVNKAELKMVLESGRLSEDEEVFQDRRNRTLDHLMARFAEQFTDYVLMMYSLEGDSLRIGQDLIADKIDFLREYPVVSRERYKAFNYRPRDPSEIWDTKNVSGLEKRVSRLAGIQDYSRRNLACDALFDAFFSTRKVGDQVRLEIKDLKNVIIFKSLEFFADRSQALNQARKVYPFVRREQSYVINADGGVGQVFYTLSGGGVSLRNDTLFETQADALQSIRAIIDQYDAILQADAACNREGFHLIEHILLRPFTVQDDRLAICIKPNCESCGDEDPYSFRLTAVLPYWPQRFRNLKFRRYFESLLRQEAPAHIHVRLCWVGNDQMVELDEKYRAWLAARGQKTAPPSEVTAALNNLISVLKQLKTIYPAATLHDCVEGEDENLVRLDSTNLGIF